MIKLNVSMNKITQQIENTVISLINKKPPQCYDKMIVEEVNEIIKKVNIPIEIIYSMRSSYIKYKMIKKHHFLKDNIKKIIKDYNNGMEVLELSKKYDGSPLNILRLIFDNQNINFKKVILNPKELLTKKNYEQFKIAEQSDFFAIIDGKEQLKQSMEFENKIEDYLKLHNIKYQTQNELVEIQTKEFGHPISTPDFLIKSDLYINDKKINWIDAKNFYGANNKFIINSIDKQIKKYLINYGSGCIIFSLNVNENLKFNDVLLINYGDLIDDM